MSIELVDVSLFAAALNGNLPVVRKLVADGANVNVKNQKGETPLLAAAANGHLEVAKFLIASGADKSVLLNS